MQLLQYCIPSTIISRRREQSGQLCRSRRSSPDTCTMVQQGPKGISHQSRIDDCSRISSSVEHLQDTRTKDSDSLLHFTSPHLSTVPEGHKSKSRILQQISATAIVSDGPLPFYTRRRQGEVFCQRKCNLPFPEMGMRVRVRGAKRAKRRMLGRYVGKRENA